MKRPSTATSQTMLDNSRERECRNRELGPESPDVGTARSHWSPWPLPSAQVSGQCLLGLGSDGEKEKVEREGADSGRSGFRVGDA